MIEKVIALGAHRNMYMGDGFHLVRPEKTFIIVPESYVPTPTIITSIQMGELIDWNKNVLDYGKKDNKVEVEVTLVQPSSTLDNIGAQKKESSEESVDSEEVTETTEDTQTNSGYNNKKRNR